jgi:rubrerythrin
VSVARDEELALEALRLEREAVRRYVAHSATTADPRLFAYWESLRRNEAAHRDVLEAQLRRLRQDQDRPLPTGGTTNPGTTQPRR